MKKIKIEVDEALISHLGLSPILGYILDIGSYDYTKELGGPITLMDIVRGWFFDERSYQILKRLWDDKTIADMRKMPRFKQNKLWMPFLENTLTKEDLKILSNALGNKLMPIL